ncbi:MAG: anti-sigma regulatory factor [Deltaproteobacteria bacterium]|nr:anti-sigma regulatory factor [Deltaproteobacteria bacterium]
MNGPNSGQPEHLDTFTIQKDDFASAGSVSISIKNVLKGIGLPAELLRRVAIVAFEAEMNVVMYGGGGEMRLFVSPEMVRLMVMDQGPGIPDLELAMTEGWSTATPEMREMGFGAGMGLPNIRKNTDRLSIDTSPGRGTTLLAEIDL